jgi:cytochrome P450
VERLRVEALVEEIRDRAEARGEMELVAGLARPLPAVVIAELLGVPAALHERFAAWSDDPVQLLDPLSGHGGLEPPKRAHCAVGELHGRLEAQALLHRRGPAEEQPGSCSA